MTRSIRSWSAEIHSASAYRAHAMNIDYANVLVAVKSATDACVRVLVPRWEMYSTADGADVRLLGGFSRVDAVVASGAAPALPVHLFGREPARGWCYYFEQASLAAQDGDWEQVAAIQREIGKHSLHPNDQIEWMPFLLAQAHLGDLQAVKEIATQPLASSAERMSGSVTISSSGTPLRF